MGIMGDRLSQKYLYSVLEFKKYFAYGSVRGRGSF